MKKFCKFVLGTLSLATLACGGYYFFKKYICKETHDEFDDFEDETDDFEFDDNTSNSTEERGYVSINITSDGSSHADEENQDRSEDNQDTSEETDNESDTSKEHEPSANDSSLEEISADTPKEEDTF